MKPYDWMVTYTPQTDWIKGSGAVVWLSFFAGLFGSGAYLASLYYDSFAGTIASWLIIAVLKGGLHVGHTKRPIRLWRMVLKVRTSWISRGMVFTALTALFGAVQIILSYEAAGTVETLFRVLTAVAAFAVMIYEGFTINYISGIPFWNSSLLPATLISWAISGGLSLVSVIASADIDTTALTSASRVALIVTAILTVLYLWNALYAGAASKESMKEMMGSALFWVAVVLIGIVIPLAVLFGGGALVPASALAFLVCEFIGTLAFTYGVFRAGVYRPLI